MTSSIIIKKHPDSRSSDVAKVAVIWDEVVSLIIQKMIEYSAKQIPALHINLREEMALELAKLTLFVSEKVVDKRLNGRLLADIDEATERDECFNEEGLNKIEQTALNMLNGVWVKLYNERWKKKSEAFLAKDEKPKITKISPKPVEDNHFIPKSFIRRYWSSGQHVFKFTKIANSKIKKAKLGLGQWGFAKNLYSDYLEAYFGLLEGDAVRPMEMLLNVEPLNRPQRESLIGFMVIQRLRNPQFMDALKCQMIPIVASEVGGGKEHDEKYMRSVYETLYQQNDFYDKLARPILYSKWVVVRSEEPIFVLPDTCNIFGKHDECQYVIMPFTPTDCLVVLPVPVSDIRIVPHYIKADLALAKDISAALVANAKNEFIADQGFQYDESVQKEPNKIIQRIILSIAKITADDQRYA
ncbi:MAG: DUF4238 domain-containing protein [Thermoplasmatales archaeon]|nr:DUF4238 domain-containing protein [Thermoplasmatales archaeon]